MAGERGEAAVFADAGCVGSRCGGLEPDLIDLEAQVLDGLLDEVGVAVADVGKSVEGMRT